MGFRGDSLQLPDHCLLITETTSLVRRAKRFKQPAVRRATM